MALSISMTTDRQERELSITAFPGLAALGLATLLQATVSSPLQPALFLLLPLLLLCAGVQILVGLTEWHRGQLPLAVTFIAFGLFTCSQIPQIASPGTDPQSFFAVVTLQLFWGLFALLLMMATEQFERPFRLVLGAVGATLLGKAALLASGWTSAWPVILLAGVVVEAVCCWALLQIVTRCRS